MTQGNESVYARQLSRRAAELQFDEPLEGEFRRNYGRGNTSFVRIAAIQGLVLVSVSAFLDWRLAAGNFVPISLAMKLAVMAPAFLLLLYAIHSKPLNLYVNKLTLLCAVALSAGSVGVLLAALPSNLPNTVLGIHVVTIFIYLMLGLRLLPALTCALPLTAVLIWVETNMGVNAPDTAFDCVFLLFTNVVGALTCYRLEYAARTNFLEHEIVKLLSGNDSTTGIPNRRYFARHLQTVKRQAGRDGKAIAVLLAEIADFDDFKRRHGEASADATLKRVANAIVHELKRPLDIAAKLGSQDFGIVLYDPDPNHIQALIKQIRQRVAALNIAHNDASDSGLVAIDVGAVISPAAGSHDIEQILELAELALGQAREPENQGVAVLAAGQQTADGAVTLGPWAAASALKNHR